MMDFPRSRKPLLDIPLIPLIDVAFILIIFFMLTTSFMKIESMEIMLPAAGSPSTKKVVDVNMAHIYLHDRGQITYGQRPVDKLELQKTLLSIFQNYPEQRVVVLVARGVSLQSLVDIMDLVYTAGGKNVFVKEWEAAPANAPTIAPLPAAAPAMPVAPVVPVAVPPATAQPGAPR